MKKIWNILTVATLSLASGAMIGTGAYFLFFNKDKTNWHNFHYGKEFISHRSKHIEILEGPNEKGGHDYFLSDQGVKLLVDKIDKYLDYGPEIEGVKKIIINDTKIFGNGASFGNEANGLYFPATHEIHISTRSYVDNGAMDYPKYFTHNMVAEARSEMLFEVIYHEYNHYMADTYLNSIPLWDQDAAKDIYNIKDHVPDNWDKDFIQNFEQKLMYKVREKNILRTIKSPKYDEGNKPIDKYNSFSIGSLYSAGELFEYTNNHKIIQYPHLGDKNYVFASKNTMLNLESSKNQTLDQKMNSIKYKYSMPELFVRKYQQLTMRRPTPNGIITDEGWYKGGSGGTLRPLPIAEDALNYQNGLDSTPDQVYLDDGPYSSMEAPASNNQGLHISPIDRTKASSLYGLMDRHMGHTTGSDISVMWSKNESKLLSSDKSDKIIIENSQTKVNHYLIKFGGYIPNNAKYTDVGYKDSDGKFISISKLVKDKFNFRYKNDLESMVNIPVESNYENQWYVTKNYIDVNKFINKNLFFATLDDDKKIFTDIAPLKTVRSGNNGTASTYRSVEPLKQNYQAKENNGNVSIGTTKWGE